MEESTLQLTTPKTGGVPKKIGHLEIASKPQHNKGTTNGMSKHRQARPTIAWHHWRTYLIRTIAIALLQLTKQPRQHTKQHNKHNNKKK